MAYDSGGLPPGADEDASPEDRCTDLGEGIASYPVLDLVNGNVVVQSSDAGITVEPIAAIYDMMQVRSWQEVFPDLDLTETSVPTP
jgi:hypothetical protein